MLASLKSINEVFFKFCTDCKK